MRGSWNRELRTGYKVIRALTEDGKSTGVYEDFMTGFVLDAEQVRGRPIGLAVAPDTARRDGKARSNLDEVGDPLRPADGAAVLRGEHHRRIVSNSRRSV